MRYEKNGTEPYTWQGKIEIKTRYDDFVGGSSKPRKFLVGPDAKWTQEVLNLGGDFRDADMRRASITGQGMARFDFAGANFSEAVFGGEGQLYIDSTSFVGANFSNARFSWVSIREGVDMSNANLSGVSFERTTLVVSFFNLDDFPSLRLNGSNITKEQVAQLEANQSSATKPNESTKNFYIEYDKFGLDDARVAMGEQDIDNIVTLIWAGDIEVRDNKTKRIVKGAFDKDEHHIPQWEIQRLKAESTKDAKKEKDLA